MVEHTLWTVHESLVQGYCATADCATVDCARLRDKRYYCTTGKEKNTIRCACNTSKILKVMRPSSVRIKRREYCCLLMKHCH